MRLTQKVYEAKIEQHFLRHIGTFRRKILLSRTELIFSLVVKTFSKSEHKFLFRPGFEPRTPSTLPRNVVDYGTTLDPF